MTSFDLSKTWITPEFAAEFAPESHMALFPERQKVQRATCKDEFLAYRKGVEATMNKLFDMLFKVSPLQHDAVERFRTTMRERLGPRANEIADKIGMCETDPGYA